MYSVFEMLCEINGVTPYKVGKATKIATSTLSDWKNGKSNPKQDKLKLIADYFNVSVDYLMTGKDSEQKEKPPIPDWDDDTMEMIRLFSQLNKEQKNSILAMMRSFALTN